MSTRLGQELQQVARIHGRTVALPCLVRGKLVYAPPTSEGAGRGAHILVNPAGEHTAPGSRQERQTIVLPRCEPEALIETDRTVLARGLYSLSVADILDYVRELRRVLDGAREALMEVSAHLSATSFLDPGAADAFFRQLPLLIDADALGEAIDRELGSPGLPGRTFLDGWVEVDSTTYAGTSARTATRVLGQGSAPARDFRASVRAMPTRQLHITAGNSPVVPVVSWMRALATKGAAVVKSPAEATAVCAVLACAMRAVDADHPLTRHTSLVYWPGGDRRVEDVLFGPEAFDRILVWGSPETVRSVRQRAGHARTVFFNPRYGMSLVGRETFEGDLTEVAARASVDTMIANQRACMSSLVHFVEGSEEHVLRYCEALAGALARWDHALPHVLPPPTLGQVRLLRRGPLIRGTWFVNGSRPQITSAVVYAREPFDLAEHPMSRFVVVRRVDDLEQAVAQMSSSVSTVGVYPNQALHRLRDPIAAAGVSNIFGLGECERTYAGMPHDGMRVLSELVNWTTAGVTTAANEGGT